MASSLRRSLRFGISRGHGGAILFIGLRQFSEALRMTWGRPVEIEVLQDYDELLAALIDDRVDAAWLPPLLIAEALHRGGGELAAVAEREGALWYRSALLVRSGSGLSGVGELRGARAAWVDRISASGYIFPRLHLVEAGLDLQTALGEESFLGSVIAACEAVVDGRADLCACFISEAAARDPARAREEVRGYSGGAASALDILALTAPIPPDGIVLSPRLPAAERERITAALVELHEDQTGNVAVRSILQADRLCPASPEVLALFERLQQHLPRRG